MRHPDGPAPTAELVALSPSWLTAALETRYPGAVVAAVDVVERIRTVATKTRFRVTYERPLSELPSDFCIKGLFLDSETPLRRGLVTEPIFYRDVAATLGVRVPPCEYTGIDDATGTGIVVMRDLVVAGAVFGDPCDSYTPERSAAVLGELARLHAATWGRSPASLPRQLQPSLRSLTKVVGPELLSELLVDGRADTLPAAVTDGHRLHAAMHAMAALDADTQCLVHGDLHTGNLYTLPDGSPGLIDWQVVQLGHFALDIGYHLATALEPSVRAQYERDLLDHYLDRLASHCVTPPTREDAWLAYRSRLAYGFFMWGITRFQPRVVIEHFVHRLGQAVSEHNSLDLLGV